MIYSCKQPKNACRNCKTVDQAKISENIFRTRRIIYET
nr:MAG TPA: hypothetical protein [Bacteriophage sp.]